MRRFIILRLLAAAALVVFGIGIVLLTQIDFSTPPPTPVTFADLNAPLPADSAADLAAAMPEIDELRGQRGSLLDGSLLESLSTQERPPENSYVDLLRREARRLDGLAADDEDSGQYNSADNLRAEAHQLRLKAREVEEPLVQFGSHAINR
jgi:hypothetical protein